MADCAHRSIWTNAYGVGAWALFGLKERTMRHNPALLLFDLGGVMVELPGCRNLPSLLHVPRLEADIRRQWIARPTIHAAETGQLPPQPFAERVVTARDVAVTPSTFLREVRTWARGVLPRARRDVSADSAL
jgi:hypothetical protein